jgi:hypothetical protein
MGKKLYDELHKCCKLDSSIPGTCDLSSAVDDAGRCQSLVYEMFSVEVDQYNTYQQCYKNTVDTFGHLADKMKTNLNLAIKHRFLGNYAMSAFHTQQSKLNYASTDQNGGFICYMSSSVEAYLNQWHVRDALHIPDQVQDFEFCR